MLLTIRLIFQSIYHFILLQNKKLVNEKDLGLKNLSNIRLDFFEKTLDKTIEDDSDRALIKRILELLEDAKAEEIVLVDAKKRSSLADYLLICEGRSQLHCRGISESVEHNLKKEGNVSLGIEGECEGNWVLLDFGNIVLHVFHPEIRKYYRLEELYEHGQGKNNIKKVCEV